MTNSTQNPYLNSPASQERVGFFVFLGAVVLSAFAFSFTQSPPFILGVMALLWSGFGFFRLVYLSHTQMDDVPRMFVLPIQILFGASTTEEARRKLVIKRMAQPDVLIWLAGTMMFLILVVWQGLYSQGRVIQGYDVSSVVTSLSAYSVLNTLAFYGVVVAMMFLALSYSQRRYQFGGALFVFTPFIFFAVVMILLKGQVRDSLLLTDIMQASRNEMNMILASTSAVARRFVSMGILGAYGPYLLSVPAVIMLVKTIFDRKRHVLKPLAGLCALLLLALIDYYLVPFLWVYVANTALLAFATICWGNTLRYRV